MEEIEFKTISVDVARRLAIFIDHSAVSDLVIAFDAPVSTALGFVSPRL